MSTGPTVPIVVKQDAKTPSWLSIATAIIVAVLGTLKAVDITPAPKPIPKPGPVVVIDEIVTPRPQPAPPTPIVPHVGIVIADVHGKTLSDTVDAGVMFSVTAGNGINLTGSTETPDDADIVEFSDSKLLVTLRNGAKLIVIVTGGGEKPRLISVTCNHAPQPPPVPPVVDPVNPPVPNPTPVVNTGVRVLILREAIPAKQALTAKQVAAIDSPKVTDLLNAKCAKDSAGRPAWHRWDKDVDLSGLPQWSKIMAAVRAKIASDGISFPVLVIDDGKQLHLFTITDESTLLNTLNSAFNGGV